jgi:predicted amidohydrolase
MYDESNNLIILTFQNDTKWMDPTWNLYTIEEELAKFNHNFEICILPELFTTGFGEGSEKFAETLNLTTHKWMKMLAIKHNSLIIGSLPIKDNGYLYNRCLVVYPNQKTIYYDKIHLFSPANEHLHFTPGSKKTFFQFKNWKILLTICYDLRFPLLHRNHAEQPYHLLINIANWPKQRFKAYQTLLTARAIENQCFAIGVNRTGIDGYQQQYQPVNFTFDYKGDKIKPKISLKKINLYILNLTDLHKFKEKFDTLKDDYFNKFINLK